MTAGLAGRAWLTLDARDNAPGRLGQLIAHALGTDRVIDDLHDRHCSDTVVLDRIFEDLDATRRMLGAGSR